MPRREEPSDPIAAAPLSPSLRALAQQGVLKSVRRGTLLIVEGDIGDTIFIVLSGRLRAYSADLTGREITYGEYGAGEYVGEMGLDGGARSANVEAMETSLCVMVTRPTLLRHIGAQPDFAFELLAKVIRRARDATMSLRAVALNNVYGRLKGLLEMKAIPQADGSWLIDPAPSHQEMAHLVGCGRPMISRVMKDWERGGYIDKMSKRRRVQILRKLPPKW